MSALDMTELVPDNLSQVKNPASPVKFTKEVMNGTALKVEPKETSLLKMLGFEAQEEGNLEPDFYMPDGRGGKLRETQCMLMTGKTPGENPGVMVRLENLKEKYGPSLYLLDRRSGNLYMLEAEGYRKIEEKGLLFPSESMIMAGALEREVGEPQPSMQISKIQATPAAESTRIPLRTSTEKKEKSLTSEQLSSYPSLESLDQEYKEELSDIQYAYYSAKREVIMKKLTTAYENYSAHLKEYEEAEPGRKTQKYLLQYNDISNRLYGQFEVITSMLGPPFKETLDIYPPLDPIMRMVEQEDLRGKAESFFEELMREIEIKNAIAGNVYQNKSLVVTSSVGETEITEEYEDYKKESKKLMDFCKNNDG